MPAKGPDDDAEESGVAVDGPATVASRDLLAVVGVVLGGLVVPVLGWVAGAALLWTSPTWTAREKALGTGVWPGGLLLPLALPFVPGGVEVLRYPALAMVAITVLVLAPLLVGALLLRVAARAPVTRRRSP